jgi:CubicO group peptidase (beta-lactamase class C family)
MHRRRFLNTSATVVAVSEILRGKSGRSRAGQPEAPATSPRNERVTAPTSLPQRIDEAGRILAAAVARGQVRGASLCVVAGKERITRSFGAATDDSMFLLGSISKPIAVTALMRLFDDRRFSLDDPVQRFLPGFRGEGRESVLIRHLLTHTSGLPDQVADNAALRRGHAPLAEFARHAEREPLAFVPGSRYLYSSMGILLATTIAERITGGGILRLVEETVLDPLGMTRSAQGLGRFQIGDMMPAQTEHAAPEAGGGDPAAKDWDWNSPYWRSLGAPWGGTHASAGDVARFLGEFLADEPRVLSLDTARLMRGNRNQAGIQPRGLGLDVGPGLAPPGCTPDTFGHSGSTGTVAWADPGTGLTCVVLTSLPARAVTPHPRDEAASAIALRAERAPEAHGHAHHE